MKNSDIRHSHWLGLVNIYLHAKNYQNITSGLKVLLSIQFLKILPQRGYLIGQVLSISICMPNIIKIFLEV